MKLYKLTNKNNTTQGETLWGEGVTHKADESKPAVLCTSGVIHAYKGAALALMMNPIHGNIVPPVLWKADGEIVVDDGIKVGCRRLTTIKRLEYKDPTTTQRVAFGILSALEGTESKSFQVWANNWLSDKDRSLAAAVRAAEAAVRARAAWAAEAAVRARAARAAWAAEAAAEAAWAAAWAETRAAAEAARAAAEATWAGEGRKLNLAKIADQAMREY